MRDVLLKSFIFISLAPVKIITDAGAVLCIIPIYGHLVAIIPVEPVTGAKPNKSFAVLKN
jgi:hypothetical protein